MKTFVCYFLTHISAIDCTSVTWHVTNSSIQGMVEGLFTNATATNKSQTHVSPGRSNVSFTGLYPGATYEVSLVYERNSTPLEQCSHKPTVTIRKYKSFHTNSIFVYISNQNKLNY